MHRWIVPVLPLAALVGCTPQPWTLDRAEANRLYAQGRYDEALSLQQKVLESRPATAQYQYELGRTLLAMGRATEAREAMHVAYDVKPGEDLYAEGLADAMLAAGEYESALLMLRERAEWRSRVEDYLRLGSYAERAGNADEARRAYLDAADVGGPLDARAQRALAGLYESVGDAPAAIERWRMVLWASPEDPEATARLRELGFVPGPTARLRPTGNTGVDPVILSVPTPAPPRPDTERDLSPQPPPQSTSAPGPSPAAPQGAQPMREAPR